MARNATTLLALATLGIITTGCVSQEKYNALRLDRDQLSERLADSDAEARSARREAELYKQSLDQIKGGEGGKDGLLANNAQQIAELQRMNDELRRKYDEAIGMAGRAVGPALGQALTSALTDFAAQNPDLVEFDANRGIVKFKSDVTFARGSAEVTDQARSALARFAQILNSQAASGHELLIAGHTDNTPVSNPETRRNHKDNWYLSAHRALEVAAVLLSNQVGAQRVGAVGYADQRPVADNGSESGKARNRRVEVLILPSTVGGASRGGNAGGSVNRASVPAAKPVMNKDSDAGESMNK